MNPFYIAVGFVSLQNQRADEEAPAARAGTNVYSSEGPPRRDFEEKTVHYVFLHCLGMLLPWCPAFHRREKIPLFFI